jgi:hypothetical protein
LNQSQKWYIPITGILPHCIVRCQVPIPIRKGVLKDSSYPDSMPWLELSRKACVC